MQEAILKSNFLGRDGFRWWIGQVAPIDSQGDQANGGGWGNRYKVRIMGYHPFDDTELPNDDLPWAQCLLPTTSGTGAAQSAENTKLKPGDVVFGFYLDSDNAQAPVIMGAFGRTDQVLTENYASPFVPFTGSTDRIKKPNGKLAPNESNQQNTNSAKSPRSVDTQTATKLNAAEQKTSNGSNAEISYNAVIGQTTTFANTCKDNSIDTISSTIENLLSVLQAAGNVVGNIENDIRRAISKITSIASSMVGQMFNYLYTELVGILKEGLQLLYETVFAATLASTGGDVIAAQAAGVAAQTNMLAPTLVLQQAIPCVAASILNGLGGVISDLVRSLLGQVENLAECAINQFSASVLNNIISSVESGLSGALGGLSSILSAGFSVANTLLGAVSAIEGLAGLFDCNQSSTSKCSSLTTKWKTGTGGNTQTTDFATILNNMNVAASLGSLTNPSNFDIYQTSTKNPNAPLTPLGGCYTGPPTNCNTPTISIFGGQGSGAEATAIMGDFVNYATGSTNVVNQTASIIGATITNGGSGYTFPPNVVFNDNCNQGYGAVGQSVINDAGEVTAITITSPGEFYPVDTPTNVPPYTVGGVVVTNPGAGYTTGDTAQDNVGIGYTLTISNGQIISAQPINTVIVTELPTITINSKTGVGGILKPIVGIASTPFPGTTGQALDINQCYTK